VSIAAGYNAIVKITGAGNGGCVIVIYSEGAEEKEKVRGELEKIGMTLIKGKS
jgi:mevalonate kinase